MNGITQAIVVSSDELKKDRLPLQLALFNQDGEPVVIPEPVEAPEGYSGTVAVDTDVLTFENGLLVSVEPA